MNKIYLLLFFASLILISSCREDDTSDRDPVEFCPIGNLVDLQMALGNPSGAVANVNSPNNYLMEMDEYTISYNRDRAIANWVSWYLSPNWFTGDGSRQDDFRANPFIPSDWYTPNANSYQGSGFDRGHNCPSADRLCSDNFNSATFFMTNMIPQAPQNNQDVWRSWECYLRHLANQGNELYIVMGNYGIGGDGFFGYKEKIVDGDNEITVPASIWKVAIVIPEQDGDDISRINAQSTVIAIDIPNDQEAGDFAWDDPSFITTVDDIESLTGYDLFSELPDNVESVLENKVHDVEAGYQACF